jgi:hypothetical protein
MNTPSHVIFNLAILGRKTRPEWNIQIFLGAMIPDAAMFVFYGWAKWVMVMPERQIWGTAYYQPFWQDIFAVWNSIPLALVGIGIGMGLGRWSRWRGWGSAIAICCASMLLHCLEDLPLHREDAHRHFWPLSNFRFISPISYWDPDHHGTLLAFIELGLVLLTSVYVFRLIRSGWGKGLLVLSNGLMLSAWIVFY